MSLSRKWVAAYCDLAETMAPKDFTETHAEIVSYFNDGGNVYYYDGKISFVAARVLRLVGCAAHGHKATLKMPPALVSAWRRLEETLTDASPAERAKGSFDFQECAECGAHHPFFGRYEWDGLKREHVIRNREALITVCLVCGGAVGKKYGNGFVSAVATT